MTETSQQASLALAVIPARGGSRRVPGKNIRDLFGRPIIAYTIEAARKSGLFDQVIVSTDSREIAAVAQSYGARVPFLRDANLADDFTPVSAVTVDVLQRLDAAGNRYAQVAQLMPNCPLRTVEDIRASHRQFITSGARSQISVTRYGWQNPWWAMQRNAAYQLQPLFQDRVTQRSQDQPELFCPTGAIWWAQADVLREQETFHIEGRSGWEISWQHAVDIDTEEDWAMAETLMRLSVSKASAHGD